MLTILLRVPRRLAGLLGLGLWPTASSSSAISGAAATSQDKQQDLGFGNNGLLQGGIPWHWLHQRHWSAPKKKPHKVVPAAVLPPAIGGVAVTAQGTQDGVASGALAFSGSQVSAQRQGATAVGNLQISGSAATKQSGQRSEIECEFVDSELEMVAAWLMAA